MKVMAKQTIQNSAEKNGIPWRERVKEYYATPEVRTYLHERMGTKSFLEAEKHVGHSSQSKAYVESLSYMLLVSCKSSKRRKEFVNPTMRHPACANLRTLCRKSILSFLGLPDQRGT